MDTEPMDPIFDGLPPIVEETRDLHVKMSALVDGLRGTLAQCDAHVCAAPCEVCAAVEAVRAIVRDFDRALANLGARLDEAPAIFLAPHDVTR